MLDLLDVEKLNTKPALDVWSVALQSRVEYWKKQLALLPLETVATIDFETRSACNLKVHGGWVYSRHVSTKAMCLAYLLPGWSEPELWHMAHPEFDIKESPLPFELFAYILAGGLVEAHNAFFERSIWKNVMVTRHGWPEMPHLQWRCSASKASAASLPRALAGASQVMGTGDKDIVGWKLMLKMCKPRQMRKAEIEEWCEDVCWFDDHNRAPGKKHPDLPVVYHENPEDLQRLWDYCAQDVIAEHGFSSVVPNLSETELLVWQMDQYLNERGVLIDREFVNACIAMADKARAKLNSELEDITGVSAGTKRQAVKDWLEEFEGVELPDTAAPTLEWYIEREPISKLARRVCQIVKEVNRTSIRKYKKMLDCMDTDDRVRDILMYHGAGTGRWAGKGIQVQNFPSRSCPKDMDGACADVMTGDFDWCHAMYGDVMELLSGVTRGAIISGDGRDFMVADYSSIEARCLLWEADAKDALKVFLTGGDIYCDMATGIYGYEVKKATHPKERQFGKQAILGLGYGMGWLTFMLTCRKYKIYFSRADVLRIMGREKMEKYEAWVSKSLCLDSAPVNMSVEQAKSYANKKRTAAKNRRRLIDAREVPKDIVHELALMKYTVDVYRDRYTEVKDMWKTQEAAAIKAVMEYTKLRVIEDAKADDDFRDPDYTFCTVRVTDGKITWFVRDNFLYMELPSGRKVSYRSPEVKMTRTSWGENKPALRYMSTGMGGKWERTFTYGGKLVENITQAVARDIMANAMLLAHEGDTYDTVMTVHDELVCEVDHDKGDLKEFEALMSNIPHWADGCPVAAEAERYRRYRK